MKEKPNQLTCPMPDELWAYITEAKATNPYAPLGRLVVDAALESFRRKSKKGKETSK